ncbi:bifunctional (p)ppGpp synthetase/guanosine-3',5'-bis(diphosphate) 3'-pyrophosphohydrolase [Butyrivibrio sp. INlla16]|uniref:bifunctional (p)ppGpp synthetase/guanosine-3',5'-bis(diphosphate) 3'-pyrophosphohydrolase n=1 Tax=Butyrivibrio sp. INlla16 TaxID=1520807 RepID=UPI000884E300|nr:bifunctional (p)ppGpp synthetase/guanosine-3',5'-bis(diphosphate) 3'-pyrophosphohydrolase [Butyrivibrio sp. INlla16]SDB27240.1 GTP pyrophosphokinase [Butyrivibrio sp. INlla16]
MDIEKPAWILKEKIFSEDHMFTRMLGYAIEENLSETYQALYYARDKHAGQTRKKSPYTQEHIPYIIHPLMMACHAHAMGIKDDRLLATILLHDVCEDCGVAPEELPFSDTVKEAVKLLTKPVNYGGTADEKKKYYDGIATNAMASIVKGLDRCNNVSVMAMAFSTEKMIDYVEETQEYLYPILEKLKYDNLEYNDAVFLIKYQLRSMLETIKAFIIKSN